MLRFFMAALVVPLASCVGAQNSADTCGASAMRSYIGKHESTIVVTGLPPTRIIHPKDRVTMDKVPGRLNFKVDGKGIITAVYCG